MIVVDGKEVLTELSEVVDPRHTALLVIDIQNDYCSPGGICDKTGQPVHLMPPMISNVERLIAAARSAGVLPIWVQNTNYHDRRTASPAYIRFHAYKRGYGFDQESTIKDTWGWQFVDQIAPKPGDIVVPKHRSNGFAGTDLDMILRSNLIQTVVVCGTATHGCVESTARGAEGLDYYVVLVEDACAAFKKEQHDATVSILSTRMDVVKTSTMMELWGSATPAPRHR